VKLAELQISTTESVLAVRHKARQLTLSLGADAVEATRFASGVSQICRDTLERSPFITVEFSYDFEQGQRGLWLRFSSPGLAPNTVVGGLFESVEDRSGDVFVRPRISRETAQPSAEWIGRARELLEEKSRVELMAELRDQNAALARHRDQLEATVAERTRDLQAATSVAQRASAAKSDFLSHMSHELRTPLNGVLGYTQILLRDQATTPRQKKSLEAIESCGRHLLALINEVLDLAKIEAGRLELDEKPADLHALLTGVCHITEPRAGAKGVLVVEDRAADVPRFIVVDETKLKQVLVNLMGNSAKFTEQGRVVLKSSLVAPDRLRLEVEDTGMGMTPEELAGVFEPFKQAEGGKVRGGTGLGLAITRRVVDAMGGSIDVMSQKGKGTTFLLDLPIRPAEEALTRAPLAGGWSQAGRKLVLSEGRVPHALVVDDNATNRDVAEAVLVDAGCIVSHATDGQAALDAMRAQTFDVVLMDIRMPGMSGDEAIRRIRSDPALAGAKVIAMTASIESGLVDRLHSLGFDAALQKPFEVSTLLAVLARELDAITAPASAPDVGEAPTENVQAPPALPDPEQASALAQEIEEALSLGDLESLIETGEKLSHAPGPLAACGRRLSELGGAFDFDGLGRFANELRRGRAT
jgi:signal transduction histidine kinase/DNA-binding response OmpR family regulator